MKRKKNKDSIFRPKTVLLPFKRERENKKPLNFYHKYQPERSNCIWLLICYKKYRFRHTKLLIKWNHIRMIINFVSFRYHTKSSGIELNRTEQKKSVIIQMKLIESAANKFKNHLFSSAKWEDNTARDFDLNSAFVTCCYWSTLIILSLINDTFRQQFRITNELIWSFNGDTD